MWKGVEQGLHSVFCFPVSLDGGDGALDERYVKRATVSVCGQIGDVNIGWEGGV